MTEAVKQAQQPKPLFSPPFFPYFTAVVKQNATSLMMRYFMFSMVLRFTGAPQYLKWVANIFNFTWAASHAKEWLGTFLGPDDPLGDVVLITTWMWILQIGRFSCLFLALNGYLVEQGSSLGAVWSSYLHNVSTLVGNVLHHN